VDDTKGASRGRTPKKKTQEEFEYTKGVIRGRTPTNDIQEELEDTKGVMSGRTLKKDRQEEFEDAKEVIRDLHRRKIYTMNLKIQKGKSGSYTEEGHTRRV
jgi:hypothetical protein